MGSTALAPGHLLFVCTGCALARTVENFGAMGLRDAFVAPFPVFCMSRGWMPVGRSSRAPCACCCAGGRAWGLRGIKHVSVHRNALKVEGERTCGKPAALDNPPILALAAAMRA